MRAVGLAFLFAAAAGPAQAELLKLQPRPGVELRLAVEPPRGQAAAWAILFAGGEGALGLDEAGQPTGLRGNFLVRARRHLTAAGIGVALFDAPSDRPSGLGGYRHTPAHVAEIGLAVRTLRQRYSRPVWLVGTSAGTVSVAYAVAGLAGADRPDGVVQSSAITQRGRNAQYTALSAGISAYTGAVYVVSHQDDLCRLTPASDAPHLLAAFASARPKAMRIFTGGSPPRSEPCQAMSAHGFLGIEGDVMAAIAAFIRAPR